jgi:hypothetical protein
LAKEPSFARISEKPAETLAKLSNLKDLPSTKFWIEQLDGGFEKNLNSTVPRLIAYLELAMRNGPSGTLLKTGKTAELVANLKKIQRDFIESEIDKKDFDSDQERVLAFIKKLNEANASASGLCEKILSDNALKTIAKRSAAGVGLALAPLAGMAVAIPALAGVGALVAGYGRRLPEEYQPIAKKIGYKTLFGTGLYASGALLAGPLAGLTLTGAGLAAASPTIRKWFTEHKAEIGDGAKTGGKLLGSTLFTAGKYTVGLPFLPFIGAWKLGKKLSS